jgi:hypothetical protein
MIRHDMIFTMVFGNGYHQGGYWSSGSSLDYSDPNEPSTWIAIDECYGGSLETGGYLGAAVTGPQTVAWNGNIYMREFENGYAFINTGTTSAGPYTLPATLYHLITVNGQSINNGNPASTITLGTFTYNCDTTDPNYTNSFTCGDSCILMKNPT